MTEDIIDIVRRLGGRARTSELHGLTTRRRIEQAVRTGLLVRRRRGVYTLPELPDAAVVAARAGGRVSHDSAAVWWRLSMVRVPDVVHVTVCRGSRRRPIQGVRYHWSSAGGTAEPDGGRGVHVTPVLQTVLDCAATMPFNEALAVADSALAWRLVDPAALLAAAEASPRTGRRKRLRVIRAADGRSANAFESCLRAIVLEAGLSGFEPQVTIELSSGRVVRVDLADVTRRIVLEADSYEHHGGRADLVRDCERYDDLVADGWVVLRFSWEHVMFRPAWVGETIKRAVRRQFAA